MALLKVVDLSPPNSPASSNARSAMSADGRWVLWASNGEPPRIIDLADRTQRVLAKEARYVASVRVAPTGWGVVADDRAVHVVEMATGNVKKVSLKKPAHAALIEPGVLAILVDGEVAFLDAKTGKPQRPPLKEKGVCLLEVSAQGSLATVVWNTEASVTLWKNDKPTRISAWPGAVNKGTAKHLSFSPDGSHLAFVEDSIVEPEWDDATSSWRSRPDHLRVVDVPSGRQVLELPGLDDRRLRFWSLIANDRAFVLSTEPLLQNVLTADRKVTVSILTLASKPSSSVERELTGFDGVPAMGAHGILVNRSVFLAAQGGAAPAKTPAAPAASKAKATAKAKAKAKA